MDNQNKRTPLVSLGLMAYNRAYCLPQLLDCLLGQTFKDFELIISDDVSSDGTQQICEEYARGDPRIRYIRQPKNLNAPTCFKAVLSYAHGTYFAWIQDDDLYDKHFLEDCVRAHRRNPDLVLVFIGMVDIDKDGNVIKRLDPATYMPRGESAYERLKSFSLLHFSDRKGQLLCGLWKREAILDDPLFGPRPKDDLPRFYWGFDNYFVFRNLAKGPIAFIPEVRFFHRVRSDYDQHIERPFLARIALSLAHRFEKIFGTPYYFYILRLIAGMPQLSFFKKMKLMLWTAFVMVRIFFVRTI